jgi:mannose-6-phosphate isomerase-like protein (cupin superfamily)
MIFVRELQNVRPEITPGEKFFDLVVGKDKQPIGVCIADIKEAPLHYHKKTKEWYYVLDGKGKIFISTKTLNVKKGTLVFIESGLKHKAKRIGNKKLLVLVVTCPPFSKEDYFEVAKK